MDKNKEYEYSGLLINGFAMIVITFVIIPALVLFFLLNDSFSALSSSSQDALATSHRSRTKRA